MGVALVRVTDGCEWIRWVGIGDPELGLGSWAAEWAFLSNALAY